MNQSRAFWDVVSAQAFRWNIAGKVNAIGVQVTEPRIDRNLSSLSPSMIVITTTTQITQVLVMFLLICLFLVFSQPSKRMFSIMILTG